MNFEEAKEYFKDELAEAQWEIETRERIAQQQIEEESEQEKLQRHGENDEPIGREIDRTDDEPNNYE